MNNEHNSLTQDLYLAQYEEQLTQELLKLSTSRGILQGQLLETPDLDEIWQDIAAEYLVDGVKEIADYPLVALGWMMYVGMALAQLWDTDWITTQAQANYYPKLREARGFDAMDEHIREYILGLPRNSASYQECEKNVQSCAQLALNKIRHEHIEAQSPMAFHVYVRSLRCLYRLGIAVQLRKLGYNYQAIPQPNLATASSNETDKASDLLN